MLPITPVPEHLALILQFEKDMLAKNNMSPNKKFDRSKARQELKKIGRPLLPQILEHLKQNHAGKSVMTMKDEVDLFIGWTKLIPAITDRCAYIGVAYIDQNMDEWIKLCERELAGQA